MNTIPGFGTYPAPTDAATGQEAHELSKHAFGSKEGTKAWHAAVALLPSVEVNQPITTNAGLYIDSGGNYRTQSGQYGYGTDQLVPGSVYGAGYFRTERGQFPPLGPQGQLAYSHGPGEYGYKALTT